jgi:ligand-binding sensor domain-containing protein
LVNHDVQAIDGNENGGIWIATLGGLGHLKDEVMHNYHVEDGLLSDEVNTVFVAKNGAVWIGTDKGLNVIRNGVLSTPESSTGLDSTSVHVLYEDMHENLLIGTDKGLAVLSLNDVHSISPPKELCEGKVTAICQDDQGLIWVGTERGLCRVRMDAENPGAMLYEPMDLMMEDREISAIVQGPTGDVWIGTTKGLIKFDGVNYEEYSISESSNSNIIGSLYFDMEGNLWIGTYSGLYKYRGNSFLNYSVEEGLSGNFIFPILRDSRDDLWIGTNSNGLNRYDGESFEVFRKEDGLANNSVKSALEDRSGNIWVGTDTGLTKIRVDPISKKVSFTTFTTEHGLVSDLISSIYQDENGKLYFAGTGGITIFDGHRFETFFLDKPYQSRDIWSVVKTKEGQLWIGTYKGGIFTFDGRKFTRENDRIGLHSDVCLAMVEDERGNLWIGTFEGVFMYDGRSLVTFDENEGLTSNLIYTLTVDNINKNLWIGTNQGLNKLKLTPFYESNLKIIEHYGKEEGFVGVECNSNGVFNEADGSIWFGTVKGLSHYVPNAYFPNEEEAKTNILKTKIFYHDTVLQENPILNYDQNHISFDYVGICLTNPSKVSYKYRLVGYDKAWSPVSKNQTATYSSLPAGKYTFEVISCNNELKWNKTPTSFSFTIDTPYWKTWWFSTFGILLFAGTISLIFYIRIRNIRKSNALRLRMDNLKLEALRSQMNPHFIFNSMNAIQHYINGNDKKLANDYLSKFAALMRLILDNSQKESIPVADDLKALELYISLEQLRFEDKFTYSISIDPHIDPGYLEIPPNLIQPFVENAINHGLLNKKSSGTVTISMQMDNNYIHCIVEDDGIGREAAAQLKQSAFNTEHKPFGMQITKDRIQILNELEKSELHIVVEDLKGEDGSAKGTRVVLNIPVETDE